MRVIPNSARWLWLVPALLLVFAPVSLNAQDDPAPSQPLTPLMPAGGAQTAPDEAQADDTESADELTDVEAEFAALQEAYATALGEYGARQRELRSKMRDDYAAAETGDEKKEILEQYYSDLGTHPGATYGTLYVGLARKAGAGSEIEGSAAIEACTVAARAFPASDDSKAAIASAIAIVLEHHLDHPKLASVLGAASRMEEPAGSDALRKIVDEAADASVQERAILALLRKYMPSSGQTAEQTTKALAIIERMKEEFPEAYEKSKGAIFQLTRLQIGMEVPDIEGTDRHGMAFKLSDYRGKVVVVNFWGFW